jgi:putative transposase
MSETKRSLTTPLQFGCVYHIHSRGVNQTTIFFEERNYAYFLELYTKHVHSYVDTYAYCLLGNHFHLLVRVKEEDEIIRDLTGLQDLSGLEPGSLKPKSPSQVFSNLFNAYTKAINKACNRSGSLLQRPFGRKLVSDPAYFTQLVVYTHQNPQKHGFVDDFRDWPYSSYKALFSDKKTRLKRDVVRDWFGDLAGLRAEHMRAADVVKIRAFIGEDD